MAPEPIKPNDGSEAVQQHPPELPDERPPLDFGERNIDLPEQLVNALKNCCKEYAGQEIYIRRREVLRDRKNRFYERGYQHIYENFRTGGFTQGTPGALVSINGQDVQCPNYIDDYNIFQPYLRILESILTQNPPGIDFKPLNCSRAEDIEAAQTAEGYRDEFDRANDSKQIQKEIVRMMGLSGRTVLWTRTEANAQKFGFNEDGTPKQMEITTVHGTLESRVFSLLAKSQDKLLACVLFDDPDVKQAKADYPEFKKKIKADQTGIGENAYERTARLGVLQGTRSQAQLGDAFTHLVTRGNWFLRPASFEGDKYEDVFDDPEAGVRLDADGQPMTVCEVLKELFPSGCHVVFVGDTYVGSWDESMDDALVIGFPYEGDGFFRMAMMDPMVVVQDRFNDNMNAAAEVFDMGWPSTWVDCEDQEFDAIVNQKADPYAIRQKKRKSTSQSLEDDFFREPNPELPSTFVELTELMQGPLPQFIIAAPPALFGAAMEDQKTASGYAQARAQAMGQQGLVWASIQSMMARMYYQAALCASKNPDHSEEIVVPGEKGQPQSIRLDRLTKGKFGAYPDKDSSFPETSEARRANVQNVVTLAAQFPPAAEQVFSSPDNWKVINTELGGPELCFPEAEARDKQEFEIELLLEQSPIPASPEELAQAQQAHAAMALAAPPGTPVLPFDPASLMKSSVPVDPLDFHEWEAAKIREWLSSAERRRWEAQQSPEDAQAGLQNLRLHYAEHIKMEAQNPTPQPPPMPMRAAGPPQGPQGQRFPAAPGAPGQATA